MRRSLPWFLSVATAALIHAVPAPAWAAGDLDRIESAHKDKDKNKNGSSSSSSSSSSGSSQKSGDGGVASSIVGGVVSSLANSSGSGSGEDTSTPSPSHALAMSSYADDESSAYAALSGPEARMPRYGELSLSGFSTLTPHMRALDTQMNVFLSAFTMHAAVTRFYESDTQNLQTLDLFRLQVGLNVFHGWVKSAELHVTGGVLGMHGNEWTPGAGVRTDLRLYPVRPLSIDIVGDATFFKNGPPLVEAQVLPGATFARLDLRVGMGMLFQQGIAPSIGPRLQAGIRF